MKNNQIIYLSLLALFLSTITVIPRTQSISSVMVDDDFTTELLDIGVEGMDWTLEDVLADTQISFSNYRGKVVVLDFFATWCQPCKESMPILRQLRNSYSTQDLILISVGTDPDYDSESQIETFANEYNINWKVVRDTIQMSNFYEITNIPTIYIFDTDQKISFRQAGIVALSTLESNIDSLIGSSATPTPTEPAGEPLDGFWVNNWWWVVIIIVFAIIGVVIFVQRRRVIEENKRIRREKLAEKKRRTRKRRR